jgi:hypothetical protein
MSDKPFDAEACNIGGLSSTTNGLTDATNGLSDMKNAPCNRPLNYLFRTVLRVLRQIYAISGFFGQFWVIFSLNKALKKVRLG